MYKVFLADKKVQKQLDSLPKSVYKRVREALLFLEKNPRPHGSVRKLVASEIGDYRLRVGKYRIIYDVDDKNKKVTILEIVVRGKAYR